MATRCYIALKENNEYKAIYCHYDGYPEVTGELLEDYYTDINKIRKLINLGDISYLQEEVDIPEGKLHSFDKPLSNVTVAYHRDRDEDKENTKARIYRTQDELESDASYSGIEYLYIFDNDSDNPTWTNPPL